MGDVWMISREVISRHGRLRVNYYEIDLEGGTCDIHQRLPLSSEVIIAVYGEKCEGAGNVSRHAPNGVSLTAGIRGYVPAGRIPCVRRRQDYKVFWADMSQRWGRTAPRRCGMDSVGKERENERWVFRKYPAL